MEYKRYIQVVSATDDDHLPNLRRDLRFKPARISDRRRSKKNISAISHRSVALKERFANIHDCMVYNNQQFSPHHSKAIPSIENSC